MLAAARNAALTLAADAPIKAVLHGDFIDKNLLLRGSHYVAIDPIAHVGDPSSDVGFFAAGRPPAGDVLALAASIATRLGLDALRAQRWAAVWAVHQTVQAWRSDQAELEEFAAMGHTRSLLEQ